MQTSNRTRLVLLLSRAFQGRLEAAIMEVSKAKLSTL